MSSSPGAPRPALARAAVDRAAAERDVEGIIDALRADRATRVLAVSGDRAPVKPTGELGWLRPAEIPDGARWSLLGRDAHGSALLTAAFEPGDPPPGIAAAWATLRAVGAALPAEEAAVLVTAVSLARWLWDARFCPRCGAETALAQAGWSRRCGECGRQHFPRTDPAVIVAVTDPAEPDRLLLGSNATWGADRYSCFAGFVEAGESLEQAVHREVQEEAGVRLTRVDYRGSQAWPYPRSLMVGFVAEAADPRTARADGEEIVDVRWFTREEIGAALAGGGDLTLPGPASIAHALITDWHAGAA